MSLPPQETKEAIAKRKTIYQRKFDKLKLKHVKIDDDTGQIYIPPDSSLREKRFISIQGGGILGVSVVRVLRELEKTGVLQQSYEWAGSSVGSIVSTLASVGYTADELETVLTHLDFTALQDKNVVGWIESSRLSEIFGNMADFAKASARASMDKVGLIKKIQNDSKELKSVYDSKERVRHTEKPSFEILKKAETAEDIFSFLLGENLGIWKGEALENLMMALIAYKTGKPLLTFKELAILSQDPQSNCKQLNVTVTDLTDRITEYCNRELTPDEPIAKAVRKSASYPVGFQAVKEVDANGRVHIKSDGGILENLPDIFNKPPYYTPTRENPTNPEALAIVFKSSEKSEQQKKITGKDMLAEFFNTLLSEKEVLKKYGPKDIIFIDRKGITAMDFDLTEDELNGLLESGEEGVLRFFDRVFMEESSFTEDYNQWSLNRLIKKEAILQYELSRMSAPVSINSINGNNDSIFKKDEYQRVTKVSTEVKQVIASKLKRQKMSESEYNKLLDDEFQKLKLKGQAPVGRHLTDEELKLVCDRNIKNLERDNELEDRLRQLELEKDALLFRRQYVYRKLVERPQSHFHKVLSALSKQGEIIQLNRQKVTELDIKRRQNTVSERDFVLEKSKLDHECRVLERKRFSDVEDALQNVIKNDDLVLRSFFEEIKDKLQENPNFVIPSAPLPVLKLLTEDIVLCDKYILHCNKAIQSKTERVQILKQNLKQFEERTDKSEVYRGLVDLKREVDIAFNKRVTALSYIDAYLWKKVPYFGYAISGFVRVIAFSTLFCISLGPISLPIAWLTQKFSSNPSARYKANRFLHHIGSIINPNTINAANNLKAFQERLKDLILALNKNYEKADTVEHTYLYRLVFLHLKQLGLKFEDLIERLPKENDNEFAARVQKIKDALKVDELMQSPVVIKLGNEKEVKLLEPLKQKIEKERKSELTEVEKSGLNQFEKDKKIKFINKKYDDLLKKGLREIDRIHKLLNSFSKPVERPSERPSERPVERSLMVDVEDLKLRRDRVLQKIFAGIVKFEEQKKLEELKTERKRDSIADSKIERITEHKQDSKRKVENRPKIENKRKVEYEPTIEQKRSIEIELKMELPKDIKPGWQEGELKMDKEKAKHLPLFQERKQKEKVRQEIKSEPTIKRKIPKPQPKFPPNENSS